MQVNNNKRQPRITHGESVSLENECSPFADGKWGTLLHKLIFIQNAIGK